MRAYAAAAILRIGAAASKRLQRGIKCSFIGQCGIPRPVMP